jgi:hypothetical protein
MTASNSTVISSLMLLQGRQDFRKPEPDPERRGFYILSLISLFLPEMPNRYSSFVFMWRESSFNTLFTS